MRSLLTTLLVLFAQSSEQSVAAWAQIIGALGTTGFTGWLAWYLITKHIPEQSTKYDKYLAETRADFKDEAQRQRDHDARQAELERKECETRHKDLITQSERWHKELLARLDSNHILTREISHGVKDALQVRANERALQEYNTKRRPATPKNQGTSDET